MWVIPCSALPTFCYIWAINRWPRRVEKARVSIHKSSETAEAWRTQAWKQGWIYQLTTVGKIAAIAVVLCCTLVTAYAGWRALPLVRGEVQVVYTQEYQTELDELHEEVSALKEQLANNDD